MSEIESQLEQISSAVEALRQAPAGPGTRKAMDALFRTVHSLKAAAAADGLIELSHAAHELENVLHSLRTSESTLDASVLQQLKETSVAVSESVISNAIPDEIWRSLKAEEKYALKQSVLEDANLFFVQASFDVADFDRQFQNLKEKLSSTGEMISIAPKVESEHAEKINFRILYARAAEVSEIRRELETLSGVTVEELLQPTKQSTLLQRAIRAGRLAALELDKEVAIEVRGEDLLLDESLCDAIATPLLHLVRNAVAHGIEASDERVKLGKEPYGKILVETTSHGDRIIITVTDDGRGIDPAMTPLIFRPGFSTAPEVSAISGRGVGLDVVKTTVEALGGSVKVASEPGKGSAFEIELPR